MRTTLASASFLAASVLAAACGSTPPGASPGHKGGGRCPAADAVRYATWYEPLPVLEGQDEPYDWVRAGTPNESHWQIVLAIHESEDPWHPPPPPPAGWHVGPRTEAEVRAMVDGSIGGEAWVFAAAGAAPCRAAVTSWYVERTDNGAYPYLALVAKVDGCPRASADAPWGVWVGFGPQPTGCQLATPAEVTRRDGEFTELPPEPGEEWGRYTYVLPKTSRELPAPFASVVPRRDCAAPGCEPLWSVRRAGGAGGAAFAIQAAWLRPGDEEEPCMWEIDYHEGIYLDAGDGALVRAEIVAPRFDWDTGETRPMPADDLRLAGVLHDGGGARVLLTHGYGEYGAHDVTGTRVGAGRITMWYIPHEEGRDDLLGPYCGIYGSPLGLVLRAGAVQHRRRARVPAWSSPGHR